MSVTGKKMEFVKVLLCLTLSDADKVFLQLNVS